MPGIGIGHGGCPYYGGMITFGEHALVFRCEEAWLYGVLSLPEQAASRGVLIVVGGPQYRVGSHRQFALLARYLASNGIPVMRFDVRGMGDSEGDARTFEDVGDDLRCAIDEFLAKVPLLKELVILGLCDAASAALFYAYQDRRVTGLVLLNPWVRTEEGSARAHLKHYYTARLFQPEFWRKIWQGNFDYATAVQSFSRTFGAAAAGRKKTSVSVERNSCDKSSSLVPLPERMFQGLNRFTGKVLLVISGNDLTAQEFSDLVKNSRQWQKLLASSRVSRLNLQEANHTFSRREWRDEVGVWTKDWIDSW